MFQNILHLFVLKKKLFSCKQGVDNAPPPVTDMSATIYFFYAFPYGSLTV